MINIGLIISRDTECHCNKFFSCPKCKLRLKVKLANNDIERTDEELKAGFTEEELADFYEFLH